MLACDFLTVETIFMKRIYVLFFISLATRRIEYVACTANPDGRWVTQQARNLAMEFADEQTFWFLVHDRDSKFGRAFDDVFRAEGIKVIRTPVQGRHLEHVLRAYRCHYNEHRPHRALQLLPPNGRDPTPLTAPDDLRRRDLLGGLIHEYEAA